MTTEVHRVRKNLAHVTVELREYIEAAIAAACAIALPTPDPVVVVTVVRVENRYMLIAALEFLALFFVIVYFLLLSAFLSS